MSWGGGGDGRGGEDWRKNAETHKMRPEDVKAAGVDASKRPPGHHPGTVLHQRRRLPYSYTTMALAGFAISLALGYVVLYANKRRDASAGDVARAAMGTGGQDHGGTSTTVRSGVPPRK